MILTSRNFIYDRPIKSLHYALTRLIAPFPAGNRVTSASTIPARLPADGKVGP